MSLSTNQRTKISKFLSLVLRHQPDAAGVTLDDAGWVDVDELLAGCGRAGRAVTRVQLDEVVETNDKKRFEFSADGTRIRASQGHSVEVDLGYQAASPPDVLYHGTADRNLDSIRAKGLLKGQRHHVHLSAEVDTATSVGQRYGRPVVLHIRAAAMVAAGHAFYVSTNGVWLVEHVPTDFISFPDA
ncbi:MAG: RNA 2'-phosphotransferase [Phycisphaera sp.]|nr:RNA 2'-phosphotransferase [Phycisphaera sp.]